MWGIQTKNKAKVTAGRLMNLEVETYSRRR